MNTNRTSKAFIVRTAITLFAMLFTSATAWAENVSYIDENGDEKYVNATILTSETDIRENLPGGCYIVKNTNSEGVDVSFSSQVNFGGDTSLILADGASITIVGDNGIVVYGNLNIYSQSEGTGSLSTKATGYEGDGIYASGSISIIGGIINTTSDYQHGITNDNGDITITGGKVTANGKQHGIYASNGNITLGYTNDTDRISANSYEVAGDNSNSISISSGKTMIDGETLYSGTLNSSDINNKILAPNLFNISDNNDGSSNSKPYIINSTEGLQLLATYVNSGTICAEFNVTTKVYDVYNGVYFKINCDIEFNPTIVNNFTPIGGSNNVYYAFCGSFDGDGHTISGINIDINEYAGIFGYIGIGAEIKKVTLDNAIISGNQFTGGIVGKSEGGSISNCLVTNSSIDGSLYTGAIAGENTFEGILDHNYYSGCTVDGTPNVYNVGCGTDETPQDITALNIKGIEYLDGAVGYLSETAEYDPTLTENQDVYFFRDFTAGVYSTIVLPFSYTPNDEGTFYTFTDIIKGNGSYVATMTEITSGSSLEANMPYLFKPNDTKRLLFKGKALKDGVITAGESESGNWKFKGTYKKLKYGSDPFTNPVYGFAAKAMGDVIAGEFVRADVGAYIPPMRCFLKYGLQSGTRGEIEELPERITVKLVNDPTSIGTLNTRTGEVTFDSWYSLDGRRFSSKPTRKGLYINKGIKVMIK